MQAAIVAFAIFMAVVLIVVFARKGVAPAPPKPVVAPRGSTAARYAAKMAAEPSHPEQQGAGEPELDLPSEPKLEREFPANLFGFHLMFPEDVNDELSSKIMDITRLVPRPHPILPALTDGGIGNEQLLNLISADPEIAARILKTVNSSAFALTHKITRLNHAILYLGSRLVKDIALRVAMHAKVSGKDPVQDLAFEKVWSSSFLSSSIAFALARELKLENASEISTQALLSSIGNLALISFQSDPKSRYYEKMSLLERVKFEQAEYGTNSAMVGERLAIDWGLPPFFQHGISNSLTPLAVPVAQSRMDPKELRCAVVCYVASRYAELMLTEGIKDIGEIDLINSGSESTYFLPSYLSAAGLVRFQEVVSGGNFRTQVNEIVGKVATEA